MKQLVLGILAHVDAGKTTLSEAMLYTSGSIRRLGRVDNRDSFLDTYELERARGITIFSKQAVMEYSDLKITLLDTPGHIDFSAEMERVLQVLDMAVLVISGADGVQGHTQTLWRLLKQYHIPTFLFINKMDQPDTDRETLLQQLKEDLDEGCIDFSEAEAENRKITEEFYENLAMTDEKAMNSFLERESLSQEEIRELITERKVFPCFFGSALKLWGVEELLYGIERYAGIPSYKNSFGAKVFKITRDNQGNRLTHIKITGGILQVKTNIYYFINEKTEEMLEEKINQIRIYSGDKFEAVNAAPAGSICAVTGLTQTCPGQGLGEEKDSENPKLLPVLSYRIQVLDNTETPVILSKLKQMEEEEPLLHIIWNENLEEIHCQVMGEVQIEVYKSLIFQRFGIEVSFDAGSIVYQETIADTVEGVGHFEPLRHYAEVHLLLEPGEQGSGLQFSSSCSEDELSKNWQRLILTHLEEKEHKGVLTGAPVTDMKITLIAGKAHIKHTEGGDFRQATYRAVRQGLMEAESVLLEPFYEFLLEVPEAMVGRAITDVEKMHGSFRLEQKNGKTAVLTGKAPVAAMRDYQGEVHAYTRGCGKLFCSLKGYEPCHNSQEVIEEKAYEPERDLENPTGSVFCAHGAGYVVPWDEVKDHMHIPGRMTEKEEDRQEKQQEKLEKQQRKAETRWLGSEEVDAIIQKTFRVGSHNEGNGKKEGWKRRSRPDAARTLYFGEKSNDRETQSEEGRENREKANEKILQGKKKEVKEKYLLIDGYNVIFAWEELKELAAVNLDSARGRLLDILCNYQAIKKCRLIAVFDAYRIRGHSTEAVDYHNIHVIYTKEAETADQYIERFAHENGRKYEITVVTSDALEQIIITGQGCRLFSAREFQEEIHLANEWLRENFLNGQ